VQCLGCLQSDICCDRNLTYVASKQPINGGHCYVMLNMDCPLLYCSPLPPHTHISWKISYTLYTFSISVQCLVLRKQVCKWEWLRNFCSVYTHAAALQNHSKGVPAIPWRQRGGGVLVLCLLHINAVACTWNCSRNIFSSSIHCSICNIQALLMSKSDY